ncbi:MAG: hypothetical protein CMJ76_10590 [Planctomycetaceae bacterium]|nr:hypothetical protein [Planctomycetaceae bacterium]
MRQLSFAFCIICSITGHLSIAQAFEKQVDFDRDVRPILIQKCILCHGPGRQESGYRIDRFKDLSGMGDSQRQAIVLGNALKSHLYQRVSSLDPDIRMPPNGDGLNRLQLDTIARWINLGAKRSNTVVTNQKTDHWSFQQIRRPQPPRPKKTDRLINEVDYFTQTKLETRGLSLAESTNANTLIRRVYLVMLGLQPTPEEVTQFVSDPSEIAYERLIERVLASPQYGERWAQHWLDCVRYAESTGYEINRSIPNIFPYRDYVIRSFNSDLPYDRFLREQIAGDQVEQDAATGFLVTGPHDTNPSPDPRLTAMQFQDGHDEIIKTVSAVTMGLTLGCARCHDHKFDPLSQQDYYRLQAIFAGVSYGTRAEQGPEFDQMQQEAAALKPNIDRLEQVAYQLQETNALSQPIHPREYEETFAPFTTDRVRFEIYHTNDGLTPELDDVEIWTVAEENAPSINIAHRDRGATATSSPTAMGNQGKSADLLLDGSRQLLLYYKAADKTDVWFEIKLARRHKIDRITIKPRGRAVPVDYQIKSPGENGEWSTIVDSRTRYPHISDSRTTETMRLANLSEEQISAIVDNTKSRRELAQRVERLTRGPQIYTGKFHTPRDTFLMKGGDPQKPAELMDPGFISVLGRLDIDGNTLEADRRLALANAITDSDNPLTARVISNRIWQHYFGTGIVDTPSDFGVNGSAPTHPLLLDWLAGFLIDNKWSLKDLHRLLLRSATFRQTSHTDERAFAIDSQTRLLWRFPPQRLEAEVLRDTMLRASGRLNLRQFGKPFKFFEESSSQFADRIPLKQFNQEGWRRMIYGEKIRLTTVGVFGVFDCPDASQMTPKRAISTSAVQALALYNSGFVNRHARFMAEAVGNKLPSDLTAQVRTSFMRTLSRPPTSSELDVIMPLIKEDGLESLGRILFNLNEFVFLN